MPSLSSYIAADSVWVQLLTFSAVFIISTVILLALRKLALHYIQKLAGKTYTRADDIAIETIRHPSIFWAIAIGLYIAIGTSEFAPKFVQYGLSALYVLIIISVTIAAANITQKLFQNYLERSSVDLPSTGLSRTVIRAVIFAIGFLIILNSLGISITPILTALGVGGLAVALALQDTLSNLFAGIHILAEKPIRVGDYIRLNTGEEGHVIDVGWRTTRIRELSNNSIIIPNSVIAKSTIKNFYLPEKKISFGLKIGVAYGSDIDRVEQVLLEEANAAIGSISGLLNDPPPFVRFIPGFGESSLDFTLSFQVSEFTDQFLIQHELRKRIYKRFMKEGIEMPSPTRTVHIKRS